MTQTPASHASKATKSPIYLDDLSVGDQFQSGEHAMYEAQILIAEMTFVAPVHRKDRIHKDGHMHLDDFVERRERFKNDIVIACHFSTRYNGRQVRSLVEKAIPDMLDGRLHLWC